MQLVWLETQHEIQEVNNLMIENSIYMKDIINRIVMNIYFSHAKTCLDSGLLVRRWNQTQRGAGSR